jgi:hypothetical protein
VIAPDTSVVVPALLAWHDAHAVTGEALAGEVVLLAHVELEAYSTLTRLAPPVRLEPAAVAAALSRRFPGPRPALPASARDALVAELARRARVIGVRDDPQADGRAAATATCPKAI